MSTRSKTKASAFDQLSKKIDNASMSPDSKQILKLLVDMFKSISEERENRIEKLEQLYDSDRTESEMKIKQLEDSLAKSNKLLLDANSSNDKLKTELQQSRNAHDELEAYGRRESLIFSGDAVKPAANNEDCSMIARDIFKNILKLQKDPLISTAHRIGKPPSTNSTAPDKRGIIVKFVQRDDKLLIKKLAKEKKISGLYINESLTPTRSKIHNVLRQCHKMQNSPVTGTSTHNGRVFVFTKPAPNAPTGSPSIKTEINTEEKLSEFCHNFIKKPLETFLDKFGKKMF